MSAYRYLMVFLCVALICVGQVLFKYAAMTADNRYGVLGLLWNKFLILAGFIYVGATFLWVWQLKFVPLNRAYPIYAAAFVIVPLLSWIFFRERVGLTYGLGAALIVAGVVLCTRDLA
ncbi:MAG: EamA family transporter [Bacillota bacterium]